MRTIDRRGFLKLSAAGVAGLLVPWEFSTNVALASVQIPQTPVAGKAIPKYVDPLPTFVGARVTGTSLTVSMHEFQQKVLPASFYAGLPAAFNAGTYVWGYKVSNGTVTRGPLYPGFTVEATRGAPTTVQYVNDLGSAREFPVLQKYLTVDQTIHWADPLMQMGSTSPYAGPAPAVAHLHGGEVPSAFDGGPDTWFTPSGGGRRLVGPAFVTDTYTYPNAQEATTLWFHDHTMGATRLNVYAGLAAFYFLRDGFDTGIAGTGLNLPAGNQEIEIVIQDRQFDTNGQLYFPDGSGPGLNGPPPNPTMHPYWNPEFFGDVIVVNGKAWPYLEVEPRRYRFRFLDGSNARFYELRLMNLATQVPGPAFWQIGIDGGLLDVPVKLNDPANPNALRLFIAPGERADIIIDFAGYEGQTLTLVNSAKAPNPSGTPADPQTVGQIMQFRARGKVIGGTDTSFNPALPGATLRGGANQPPLIVRLANPAAGTLAAGVTPDKRRQLTLVEVEGAGGPIEVLVNNTEWSGIREGSNIPIPGSVTNGHGEWLTELPAVGSTEVWEIINLTEDAHPIHLHLVQFQIINRQRFNTNAYDGLYEFSFPGGDFIPGYGPPLDYNTPNAAGAVGGNPDITPFLQDGVRLPDPNEAGWKDTFKMFPGEVTRVAVRWAPQDLSITEVSAGQNKYPFDPTTGPGYVWHCHIIDHEDNEMMRPYHPA